MKKKKKSQKNSNIEIRKTSKFGNFREIFRRVFFLLLFSIIIGALFIFKFKSKEIINILQSNANTIQYSLPELKNCMVHKIIGTRDGQFALVGLKERTNRSEFQNRTTTNRVSDRNYNAFIAKIDLNAEKGKNIVFFGEYGGKGVDFFNDIIETQNGCLIASGFTEGLGNSLEPYQGYNWILKIDPLQRKAELENKNEVVFSKCYDMEYGLFQKMAESDGKLFFYTVPYKANYSSEKSLSNLETFYKKLVPHDLRRYNNEPVPSQGYIIGIDPSIKNGIFFNKVFGNNYDSYVFTDMLKAKNGNLILSGIYNSKKMDKSHPEIDVENNYQGGNDGFIMEFSPYTKSVAFFKCYGEKKNDKFYQILQCHDESFVVVGRRQSAEKRKLPRLWVLKTYLNNKYIFSKTYDRFDILSDFESSFVENQLGGLNFLSIARSKKVIKLSNISSRNAKFNKHKPILDTTDRFFDCCMMTKTKEGEVVAVIRNYAGLNIYLIPIKDNQKIIK